MHHRHTSYGALVAIVVLAGAFMFSMGRITQAADYVVTATVPAPLPTSPAVFNRPNQGTTFYSSSIVVGGTCPIIAPAVVVALYESTTLLASGVCGSDGSFAIPVSFGSVGTHTITAAIVNITGQTGASSAPLTLTYVIPTAPTHRIAADTTDSAAEQGPASIAQTTTTPANQPQIVVAPLDIAATTAFVVFGPQKDAVWSGSFNGGTPPYTVHIFWGDGSQTLRTITGSTIQDFSHHYPGLQAYRITVRVRDDTGRSLSRSFIAVTPAIFSSYPNAVTATGGADIVWWLYCSYALLILVLLSLWEHARLRSLRTPAIVPAARNRPTNKHR